MITNHKGHCRLSEIFSRRSYIWKMTAKETARKVFFLITHLRLLKMQICIQYRKPGCFIFTKTA